MAFDPTQEIYVAIENLYMGDYHLTHTSLVWLIINFGAVTADPKMTR